MSVALTIEKLSLTIGDARILAGVDLQLRKGEITGLIGRSGSGKSMTALAMMGLAPSDAKLSGAIMLDGENILAMKEDALCQLRGAKIGMVFQEPMTALNPLQTIGAQLTETFLIHTKLSRAEAMEKAHALLARVGLPPDQVSPARRPHELSGGQRQRVVIAMAIANKPKVLVADEPATALDVTTQAEILDLLRNLASEDEIAILLITHDLAVVSHMADNIAVMKDGSIIAQSSADAFYSGTATSLAKDYIPARIKRSNAARDATDILLKAENIACDYVSQRASLFAKATPFRAVDNVSLTIAKGENIGLVGESGCGKSTIAKALLGLHPITQGQISVDGEQFPAGGKDAMRRLRRKIQIVFQDPYSSFNPRQRIAEIVTEPFHLFDQPVTPAQRRDRAAALLTSVGLSSDSLDKYPHAFSGGQRQRIAIARALATDPALIVLDEATSALDIASRNHVLELLQSLSQTRGVSYLFITHDLSVIRDITDRVLVMRNGKIVETGTTQAVFDNPQDAYTKKLISAAPVIRWRETPHPDGAVDV